MNPERIFHAGIVGAAVGFLVIVFNDLDPLKSILIVYICTAGSMLYRLERG